MQSIAVVEATLAEKPVMAQLVELYLYDFTEFEPLDVGDDGRFGCGYLDRYWSDPDRHPFFLRVDGRLAGFALVRSGDPHDMAEFFVMRMYRRGGIGLQFARECFARFPGEWQVREIAANDPAIAFWRRAIPFAFTDDVWEKGPMQRFTMPAS